MLEYVKTASVTDIYRLHLDGNSYDVELPHTDACAEPLRRFVCLHISHSTLISPEVDTAACCDYASCCAKLHAALIENWGPRGNIWAVCAPALDPSYVKLCGNLARTRGAVNAWSTSPGAVYNVLCNLCECMSFVSDASIPAQAVLLLKEVAPRMVDASWELCMDHADYSAAASLMGLTTCATHMALCLGIDDDNAMQVKSWSDRWERSLTVLRRADPLHADLEESHRDLNSLRHSGKKIDDANVERANRCIDRFYRALAAPRHSAGLCDET
ncbi:hypothetical protein CYMTET_29086 [Cymbomonas tetramitiformis]|uniref:Uncharacterized protein n=1 Tax=Cymbomonas tetramitiformis TaxID=36881 RepID=A0AAE0FN77_9CHLO|nr:hypothetical protein CYMTET_29086 [Cymbomonas tetramitiformis]|eukprot:gene12322-14551_t